MQNKEPFEIILHVRRVTSLQSWVAKKSCHRQTLHARRITSLQNWVAKKSCHGQTLINECFIFYYPTYFEGLKLALHAILFQSVFCFVFLEVIFSFLIKKSRQKAIEIEIAFFHPLGNPKGRTSIFSFMLHISAITSHTN